MKEKEKARLSWLYIRYALERNTLIVLIVSLIMLSGILVLIANPWLDKGMYYMNYKDIHFNYYKQGFFLIGIFNSLIIAMLSISFAISSISFDSLFISYTKRGRICRSKLMAGFSILIFITIIEGIIFFLIPSIMYSRYKLDSEGLKGIGFILLIGSIEFLGSIFLTTLVRSVIVPLSVAFLSIAIRLVSQSIMKAYEVIADVVPILGFSDYKIKLEGIYLTPLWIIALALLYIGAYISKDLKAS